MAKLDNIVLKHSTEAASDLQQTIQGLGPNGGADRVRPGEIVIRRGASSIELWGLDANNQARQISAPLTGSIAPWSPDELDAAGLSDLGDVDTSDGNPGGLGVGQAGYVLTWDGLKWVSRPAPGFEFGGLVPSLNDIGDVNYAFFATESNPKFAPDLDDVLIWKFDTVRNVYEWAPVAFRLENMRNVGKSGSILALSRVSYTGIRFGSVAGGSQQPAIVSDSETSIGISAANRFVRINSDGNAEVGVTSSLTMRWGGNGTPQRIGGIKYAPEAIPLALPDDTYLPALRHVREDFQNRTIGELSNVDDAGILAGQVLAWDPILGQYKPASGIAPDLSLSSIADLSDVRVQGALRGRALLWNPTEGLWKVDQTLTTDVKFDNFTGFYDAADPNNFTTRCRICNEANVGRVTTIGNLPYMCLRTRQASQTVTGNDTYAYVRILVDGYNRTRDLSKFPANESRQAVGPYTRTDPLAPVAYEGSLGSLSNVSTADIFPSASPVWDPSLGIFKMGFPALNLSPYSLGDLGDVDPIGATNGYGLIWDGTKWAAGSFDQRLRLDDVVDVSFGLLGVANNKLVAAYMLNPGTSTPYRADEDLSASLSVSTPKADAQLGSTRLAASPLSHFSSQARFFGVETNWTLAQKLDNYIRWTFDPSWMNLDTDACVELFFYPTQFLDTRTLLRQVASIAAFGGWILRLRQDGSIEWQVQGPTGKVGFTFTSSTNLVSLNNWHHIAIVKEGNSHRLYFDGNRITTRTSDSPWTGNGPLVMGRNDLDDGNTLLHHFFRGFMQDLRVTRGRFKYSGNTYTVPFSLEQEIIDTTPQAGDFLSFDGTKWTNVSGVEANITNKSINELADVDTTSNNPQTGQALIWTGSRWEPGVPGTGSTITLQDLSDVSTNYQAGTPSVTLDQAELLRFSNAFQTVNDASYLQQVRSNGTRVAYLDDTFTCDPFKTGRDGTYLDEQLTYVEASRQSRVNLRGRRVVVQNVFYDCFVVPRRYHETSLHYNSVPNRGADVPTITTRPEPTHIPCWGTIEDFIDKALEYGTLKALSDVTEVAPTLGQALTWNGSAWTPSSSVAADVSANSINDLADVNLPANSATIPTGNVLTWDGTAWGYGPKAGTFYQLDDVVNIGISNSDPIDRSRYRNGSAYSQTLGSGGLQRNTLASFSGSNVQGRGISFVTIRNEINGGGVQPFYLYGASTLYGSTILTSGVAGNQTAFLELNYRGARFGDAGGTNCGVEGFALAPGWKFRYEQSAQVWADFSFLEVPTKEAIGGYVDAGLANLNLAPYSINTLGDVDTTGAVLGYALVWNGTNWVPSASVAASINLSSIGELIDVVKTSNTNNSTNDGSLRFDVGQIRTSRPRYTGGGMELTLASNPTSRIGWSSSQPGSPMMVNAANSALNTILRAESDRVSVQATYGFAYLVQPTLADATIPSYLQVRQEIIRSAVNYTALFLLDGNSFVERAYGWTLTNQITTFPNPVAESPFSGEKSIQFRKTNKDKLLWTTANGFPFLWDGETVWSFEFLIKPSAFDTGDGRAEYIISPAGLKVGQGNENITSGLHVFLAPGSRSTLGVWFGDMDSASTGYNANATGTLVMDSWNHVYLAQEGAGNVVLFVNGTRAATFVRSSSWNMNGGIGFGGRTQTNAGSGNSYLTAQLCSLRITRGWLPYPTGQTLMGTPVEPLPVAAGRAVFGTLNQLEDVDTLSTAPTQGQALLWNALTGKWVPGTSPAASISSASINEFVDVDTSTSVPDQGDVLSWHSASGTWRRAKIDGNGGISPLIKRSTVAGVVPSFGSLFAGELMLNMADRKLYAIDLNGDPFTFATGDLLGNLDAIRRGTF